MLDPHQPLIERPRLPRLTWGERVKWVGIVIITAWIVVTTGYLIAFLCHGAALSDHLPLPRLSEQGE